MRQIIFVILITFGLSLSAQIQDNTLDTLTLLRYKNQDWKEAQTNLQHALHFVITSTVISDSAAPQGRRQMNKGEEQQFRNTRQAQADDLNASFREQINPIMTKLCVFYFTIDCSVFNSNNYMPTDVDKVIKKLRSPKTK